MAVMTAEDMNQLYNVSIGQLKPILMDLEAGSKQFAGQLLVPDETQQTNAKTSANTLLATLKARVNALDAFSLP